MGAKEDYKMVIYEVWAVYHEFTFSFIQAFEDRYDAEVFIRDIERHLTKEERETAYYQIHVIDVTPKIHGDIIYWK